MKIFKLCNENLLEENKLHLALKLDISKKNIISFVGGGGKTSSIYNLASELAALNKKVIVTTTTHMKRTNDWIEFKGNCDVIEKAFSNRNIVTVGIKANDDKISSVGEDIAEKLIEICDILLVEADGAKMLPLKAPESHEPVILKNSTMVIGIAGIDALGKAIGDICHRPNKVCEILDVDEKHIINTTDIGRILCSRQGQAKDLDKCYKAQFRCIINKADDILKVDKAKEVATYLMKNNVISIITSYNNN